MGRLVGTIHHQLKILEQPLHSQTSRHRSDGGLRAHGRQRHPLGGSTDPLTEQICGPVQEIPQNRIGLIW